jgi:hypothetical protein
VDAVEDSSLVGVTVVDVIARTDLVSVGDRYGISNELPEVWDGINAVFVDL